MSTVAESIEAVKELPETEKGVRFRELDPLCAMQKRLLPFPALVRGGAFFDAHHFIVFEDFLKRRWTFVDG